MSDLQTPRVLSIQSHVVSGYVGNNCATFPLQLLGFEVETINSVQLSNHTGYKVFKGQTFNGDDLNNLMEGLVENDLDNYTHLLTGYVGSASFLNQIPSLVKRLKEKNPNLIYVCDPVLGDNGKMYVPEELKDIYKNKVIPLADIITPNHFELELLTGKSINSLTELKTCIQEIHDEGPSTIAVSSTEIDNKLTSLVSTKKDEKIVQIDIPKIPAIYTGSGDLFTALFLAHSHLESSSKSALEKTINTLHEILLKTYEFSQTFDKESIQRARRIELRLIQNKKIIENPTIKLQAKIF